MPDIPPASAVSAIAATAAGSASNNIVVETAVNNVPDKIAQLSRQIEVSGTLAQPPTGDTITINTLIGPLTLALPQLAQAQQDKLIQQLINLFQNQKALTIIMQPGNPPTQAMLLLPPVAGSAQNTPGAVNAAQTPNQLPPVTPNTVLSAIVLPNDVELPVLPAAASPAMPAIYSGAINPVAIPSIPSTQLEQILAESAIAKIDQQIPPLANTPQNEPLSPSIPFPAAPPVAPGTPVNQPANILGALLQAQSEAASPPTPGAASPAIPAAYPNAAAAPLTPPGFDIPTPAPEDFAYSLASLSPQTAQLPAAASLSTLLQPGTELSLRVTAVITPSGQTQGPIPPLQPNQLVATVVGNGPGGQIILKTDDNTNATLFVRQPLNAPPGTQLVITVSPAANDVPVPVALPNLMEFASLPQIIAALAQIDPAAVRQILATRVPQPGETLPGTLLLFLSAVRGGDAGGWLGSDVADALTRAGKAELLTRLTQEFQQTGQASHDDVVGEWRTYAVPILDNQHLAALYFHIHNAHRRHAGSGSKGEDNKPGPSQVRFVIDVRMSKLGIMQLDGFLRPKKLDIIMRSENRLPPWLDGELRQTYLHTLEAIGYTGGISFQTGRGSWVNVQKPAAGAALVT